MNLARELKRTWIHQTGIHLATLSVFSFTVAFISGSFLFLKNTSNLIQSWGEQHQVSVYFKSDTRRKEIDDFIGKIQKRKEIKKYEIIDQKQAIKIFHKQLQETNFNFLTPEEVKAAIPMTIRLSLKESIQKNINQLGRINELKVFLQKQTKVDEVYIGNKWIKKYISLMFILRVVGWSLIILLFIMSFFVISNSTRVSIDSRRYDIEVFELVGSSQSEIRLPFLVEGFILGLFGGITGLLISYFSYEWILELIERQEDFSGLRMHLSFLSIETIALFLFVSLLLGGLASYLCVRRINDGWAARS